MSDRITPLPWRAGTHGGCIVADDPTPDESPLGRDDESSIAYYGGVLIGESMRTADVDYAIRAANEYGRLRDVEGLLRRLVRSRSFSDLSDEGFREARAALDRVDAVRDGTATIANPRDVPAAQALIRRLCTLHAHVVTEVLGNDDPADCFCGDNGLWPLKSVDGFRNAGKAVEFIETATLAEVRYHQAAPPRDYSYLCLNCGAITQHSSWTFWQAKDDWEDEADKWRPSLHGEMDPMCKCPHCGWEHVDDDSNPGFYDGTQAENEAEWRKIAADYIAHWTSEEVALGVAAMRSGS